MSTSTSTPLPVIPSSLVQIRKGDIVLDIHKGEPVTVLDYYITPNGLEDPTIVCVIIGLRANGNKIRTTSNHFAALPSESYVVRYPSDM